MTSPRLFQTAATGQMIEPVPVCLILLNRTLKRFHKWGWNPDLVFKDRERKGIIRCEAILPFQHLVGPFCLDMIPDDRTEL